MGRPQEWRGRRVVLGQGGAKRSVRTSGQGKGDNADPKQRFERYVEMAKAAASSGDAVESEKYYQYADHFLRLMKASAR
jgi:hypothetical protein